MSCSLYVLNVIRFASIYHINTNRMPTTLYRSLTLHIIFNQTWSPRWVDCLAPLWKYRRKVSFSKKQQCIAQFSNQTRVDNLVVVNLRSYPLSCTAASWDISVKFLSREHNSALCSTWRWSSGQRVWLGNERFEFDAYQRQCL